MDIPADLQKPAGAVRIVHTHPFKNGDAPPTCGTTRIAGRDIPTTYLNDPTDDDAAVSAHFGIDGLVIDKEFITQFRQQGGDVKVQIVKRVDRCGY
jgi:hypothetical protein